MTLAPEQPAKHREHVRTAERQYPPVERPGSRGAHEHRGQQPLKEPGFGADGIVPHPLGQVSEVHSAGDDIRISLGLRGRERFLVFPPKVKEINIRNMPLSFLARQFPGT